MIRVRGKTMGAVFLFVAFLAFQSCAHVEPPGIQQSEMEFWSMQVSGDTRADYEMVLRRVRIGEDRYTIAGNFSGMAHDHLGGPGQVKCSFSGKVEKGLLESEFSGRGELEETVHLRGSFWGALNDTEGSGEWKLSHSRGRSAGSWKMIRKASAK